MHVHLVGPYFLPLLFDVVLLLLKYLLQLLLMLELSPSASLVLSPKATFCATLWRTSFHAQVV